MGKGIAGLEAAYRGLFTAVLIILAVLVILCLIRAIIGPRTADRIVSVNMMGTMVIVIIAILTVMLGEGYLADICIIYAMISFLAVIVLTKVYMGVYLEQKEADATGKGINAKSAAENSVKEKSAAENSVKEKSATCKNVKEKSTTGKSVTGKNAESGESQQREDGMEGERTGGML